MSLAAGHRLGPYEIAALIGAGGMGAVYRARDTRLDRLVAIKVLPIEQGQRGNRRERFELEARAISSLNHPHICSLFDVGQCDDGLRYLVMEYLEGESLQARLKRGALPFADALSIAVQIGEALDHAHRKGLIHRDLKPGNIMLTGSKRNQAKLLDFGLAKMVEPSRIEDAVADTLLPTETQNLTAEGMVVGTFQYMSPEQLEGKDADVRTDIFALGAVIYEMITGRKAFAGASHASLISSILKDEPAPLSSLQPMSNPAAERVVRKCLCKDPEDRWQSARDLVDELKWISDSGPHKGVSAAIPIRKTAPHRRRGLEIAMAALAMLGLLMLAWRLWPRAATPPQPQVRFEVSLPPDTTFGDFHFPVISPDGSRVAMPALVKGNAALLLRRLDSLEMQVLPGTEGASFPFWSPDSHWIAFFAQGKLKKVEISGGQPKVVCDAPGGIGGTWNRDDIIVFCPKLDAPLERVDAAGGVSTRLTDLDAARHQTSQFFPEFLPDGQHFLFYGVSAGREDTLNGAYLGSLGSSKVTPLFATMGRVSYAAPGFLVFPRGTSLMVQRWDAKGLRPEGNPVLLAERVGNLGLVLGSAYGISESSLAYRSSAQELATLEWVDRKGARAGSLGGGVDYGNPALAPDGKTVAVDFRESSEQPRDVWILDIERGTRSRLTFDSADEFSPAWSPDGQQVAYSSTRKGARDLYRKSAHGGGAEELLLESPYEKIVEAWSPDGKFLVYNTRVPGKPIELWALPLTGERKPFRAAGGAASAEQAVFSPDGRFIAYRSTEAGRQEIFVEEFPPTGGKWQVSNAGGSDPAWRHDGKELFYTQDNALMAVEVRASEHRFEAGIPHRLFEARFRRWGRAAYQPAADGQKFLVSTAPAETTRTSFTVVTGWVRSVRR